ncbi:MAG: hypothetical protein M5U34_21145 [Chloroflexi bacterium]|nr:hypothetical protein [Chloroflexota bacterium]
MAKRIKPRTRKTTTKERKTNWLLIGGMIGVGVVALFALLFASLQGPGAPTPVPSPHTELHVGGILRPKPW